MKKRNYIYVICMAFFAVFAYLLFDRGFNVKTKNVINYKENSNVTYRAYLKENNDYQKEYVDMDQRYVKKLVDHISLDFTFNDVYGKSINGYYTYSVKPVLHAYLKDTGEDIWTKEYQIFDNKVVVLNENNVKKLDVQDKVVLDYKTCVSDLEKFSSKYGIKLDGYVDMKITLEKHLKFDGVDKVIDDVDAITVNIPLSDDTFKLKLGGYGTGKSSYYDFSTKEKINYVLLVMAAFSLSLAISFLALVIRDMVFVSRSQNKYIRELNKILDTYDDKIVKIKRFYNKKKYNLIYVDSFLELLDVYEKVKSPISYREIKKNALAIFLLIDDDNAWIYQMKAENKN